MSEEYDEHLYDCPGKPECHCGYAPLAKEALRQARLDALEEALKAIANCMSAQMAYAMVERLKEKQPE